MLGSRKAIIFISLILVVITTWFVRFSPEWQERLMVETVGQFSERTDPRLNLLLNFTPAAFSGSPWLGYGPGNYSSTQLLFPESLSPRILASGGSSAHNAWSAISWKREFSPSWDCVSFYMGWGGLYSNGVNRMISSWGCYRRSPRCYSCNSFYNVFRTGTWPLCGFGFGLASCWPSLKAFMRRRRPMCNWKKHMHLLFVIDCLGSGGAQRQMVNLALGLIQRSHSVEFFVYYPHKDHFEGLLKAAGIQIHVY